MSNLLTPQQLHDYQRECVMHQLHHDESMLWLQMGLGKTPITLTTIVDRMRAGQVKKTLIFGPLRVIQAVWAREARKWSHTKHLRFSVIHGNKEKRARALFADADVYLINYESMNWLAETLDHYYLSQDKPLPFQMVVYDEISKLKNSTTLRIAGGNRDRKDQRGEVYKIKVTGWRKIMNHFTYRTGLTGTPASNGYLDLHGQYLVVDGGERLGEYVTHYKDSYFMSDYSGWKYSPTELGKQWIEFKISDITKKMDAADYLDLPDVKVTNVMVDLPVAVRKAYIDVEKNMFAQLDSGSEIEVFSRSSVSNKCLQFCNGSPYLSAESSEFEPLHDAKLDALDDVLEEASGSPVLCSYAFKADAQRIMQRFKKYRPVNLTAAPSKDTERIINEWNSGKIKLLIGHPASMGHGVDGLQESGSILVWFGMNWSLELYEQMNGRLNRQGQKAPVSIIRILCNDTVDLAVADAIERKCDDQEGLKSALQRYRDGHTTNDLEVNFF
jgi:SNF2 family DNA or RNA helicase